MAIRVASPNIRHRKAHIEGAVSTGILTYRDDAGGWSRSAGLHDTSQVVPQSGESLEHARVRIFYERKYRSVDEALTGDKPCNAADLYPAGVTPSNARRVLFLYDTEQYQFGRHIQSRYWELEMVRMDRLDLAVIPVNGNDSGANNGQYTRPSKRHNLNKPSALLARGSSKHS